MNTGNEVLNSLRNLAGADKIRVEYTGDNKLYNVTVDSTDTIRNVCCLANRLSLSLFYGRRPDIKKKLESFSGISVIVIDLSNFNKVVTVNETSRFVVIQAGITTDELTAYLAEYHPELEHGLVPGKSGQTALEASLSPRNAAYAARYGNGHEMIQGMEIVLADGKTCRIGSCAVSSSWFSNSPLPDLRCLFINWHNTNALISHMALRLFPVPAQKDLLIFRFRNRDLIPELVKKITHTEMADRLSIVVKEVPDYMKGVIIAAVEFSGFSDDILSFKKETLKKLSFTGNEVSCKDQIPVMMKKAIFELPGDLVSEQLTAYMPLKKIPAFHDEYASLAQSLSSKFVMELNVLGQGHQVLLNLMLTSAGSNDAGTGESGIFKQKISELVLKNGGVPVYEDWGTLTHLIEQSQPAASRLINRINLMMDKKEILNPAKIIKSRIQITADPIPGTKVKDNPWLIKGKFSGTPSFRLFCFPFAGGGASIFREWQALVPPGVQICGVQYPGRENRINEKPISDIFELIENLKTAFAGEIEIPYGFFGHSMGAKVAFELIRKLVDRGARKPEFLIVSGCRAPHLPEKNPLHNLEGDDFVHALARFAGTPDEVLNDKELMKMLEPRLRADFTADELYVYEPGVPLACPVFGFAGDQDKEATPQELAAWKQYTSVKFSLEVFEGDHFFIKSKQLLVLNSISSIMDLTV